MTELLFPVLGAITVFFVAVPALTLLVWLFTRAAGYPRGITSHGFRFTLVVAPTLGPLIWLLSAVVHQSEGEEPISACIVEHLGSDLCRDVILFGLVLLGALGASAIPRLWRERRSHYRASPTSAAARQGQLRVAWACAAHGSLYPWRERIHVLDAGSVPACTRGLLRPRIELTATWLAGLDAPELEAVLLHEVEHARARDPLRFFVAQVALSLNPLRRLLQAELSRYGFARETACDRRAVQRGADPLALARSIVSAAALGQQPHSAVAALGGHGIEGVRARVALLLAYSEQSPGPAERQTPVDLVAPCSAVLATLPHLTGTLPLDLLHRIAESTAPLLGLR